MSSVFYDPAECLTCGCQHDINLLISVLFGHAAAKAMKIAADSDIYTNLNFHTEVVGEAPGSGDSSGS